MVLLDIIPEVRSDIIHLDTIPFSLPIDVNCNFDVENAHSCSNFSPDYETTCGAFATTSHAGLAKGDMKLQQIKQTIYILIFNLIRYEMN